MILAIETATNVCSVAFENEAGERFEKRTESRGSHSEKLFLFIQELMQEHGFSIDALSAMLVSEGPGSYTGLRIAASGVKGLLFGSEVPLYSVSTLASFACGALNDKPADAVIHAIIDARRVHVYHQSFRMVKNKLTAEKKPEVIPIEDFEKKVQPGDRIIGTGLKRLSEGLHQTVKKAMGKEVISARSLIELYHREEAERYIQQVKPEDFDPRYYTSNQV